MQTLFLFLVILAFCVSQKPFVSAAIQDSDLPTVPPSDHLEKMDAVQAYIEDLKNLSDFQSGEWPESNAIYLSRDKEPLFFKYAALNSSKYQELCTEIKTLKILNALDDANFPPMVGFFYFPFMKNQDEVAFTALVLVLDPFTNKGAFQSLKDFLNNLINISPGDIPSIVLELTAQIHQLHNLGIVHCDIKLENIAIAASNTPKIIDFGMAHLTDARPGFRAFSEDHVIGTVPYTAPEMFHAQPKCPKVDWYSLGITIFYIYEAVMGKRLARNYVTPPCQDDVSFWKAEGKNERQFILEVTTNKDDKSFAEMVAGLLEVNPEKRWGYAEMIGCKFLKGAYEKSLPRK